MNKPPIQIRFLNPYTDDLNRFLSALKDVGVLVKVSVFGEFLTTDGQYQIVKIKEGEQEITDKAELLSFMIGDREIVQLPEDKYYIVPDRSYVTLFFSMD